MLGHEVRLAGEQALVHLHAAVADHGAVHDDLVARLEPEDVAEHHLRRVQLHQLPVAQHVGLGAQQDRHLVHHALGADLLEQADHGVGGDHEHHRERVQRLAQDQEQDAEEVEEVVDEVEDVVADDAAVGAAGLDLDVVALARGAPPVGLSRAEAGQRRRVCLQRAHQRGPYQNAATPALPQVGKGGGGTGCVGPTGVGAVGRGQSAGACAVGRSTTKRTSGHPMARLHVRPTVSAGNACTPGRAGGRADRAGPEARIASSSSGASMTAPPPLQNSLHLDFIRDGYVACMASNETLEKGFRHVVSLGGTCRVASILRSYGLRDGSYPFDWTTGSPEVVLRLIETGFEGFLRPGSLLVDDDVVCDTGSGVCLPERCVPSTRGASSASRPPSQNPRSSCAAPGTTTSSTGCSPTRKRSWPSCAVLTQTTHWWSSPPNRRRRTRALRRCRCTG